MGSANGEMGGLPEKKGLEIWKRRRIWQWAVLGAVLGSAVPVLVLFYPGSGNGSAAVFRYWKAGLVLGFVWLNAMGAWLLTNKRSPARTAAARSLIVTMMSLTTLVTLGTFGVLAKLAPNPAMAVADTKTDRGPGAKANAPTKGKKPLKVSAPGDLPPPGGPPITPAKIESGDPASWVQPTILAVPTPEEEKGAALVEQRCLGCHRWNGKGFGASDDLNKAASSHTMSWFVQMIRDPVNVGLRRMPKPNLPDQDVFNIARYLAGRGGPKGQEQPWFSQKLEAPEALNEEQLIDAGKRAFKRLNCESCHMTGEMGNAMLGPVGGDMGPDLSHIGATKDAAAIEQFLRTYFLKGGLMPFLPISLDQLKGLSEYLASLK